MPPPRPPEPDTPPRYRIADLEIDVARARVTRAGEAVPLPRLSFDLLIALVEAAPAIVTTDQLLDRVWPGLVVNPETVSQRVKLLRAALGDDSRQPRYVEVVRARGYRLVPDVVRVGGPADAAPPPAPTGAARTVAPPRRRLPLAAGALLGVALAVAGWLAWRGAPPPPAAPIVAAAVAERSIAVLPFDTQGAGPDDAALATGIAEALLHQLASLRGLVVIARTSSFAPVDPGLDARAIGARLGARYLLEGSVQRDGARLRVTAQLIDAASGAHLWSARFDRGTGDVFAMQDEIALRVAQGLELSLDAPAADRMAGQGTTNFDAYLAFLRARALLAGGRIADLADARAQLERAIALDPRYATAHVELAGTLLRIAEYRMEGDRRARFDVAVQQARALTERALALDERNGRAWLQRAYLRAFTDLAGAEADYRQGLAYATSDASGHEGLAAVLYQDPRRHAAALAELDRARRLDPLEPRYDVTRAVLLLYGRGDAAAAARALRAAIRLGPRYAPAFMRRGELEWCCAGRPAAGIRDLETALALDPSSEWTRRVLISAYLDLGDAGAARQLAAGDGAIGDARRLPLLLLSRDWRAAGEAAYRALDADALLAVDENYVSLALKQHARSTGETARALARLERLAGISWEAGGAPRTDGRLDMKSALVAATDVLQQRGEAQAAARLRQLLLAEVERERRDFGRGPHWTAVAVATTHALQGDAEAALAALARAERSGALGQKAWLWQHLDPAFDELRADPRFRALATRVAAGSAAQRRELDELRAAGRVPTRGVATGSFP